MRHTRANTRPGGGVDENTLQQIKEDLTVPPVLSAVMHGDDADTAEQDDISMGELENAFNELADSDRGEDSVDGQGRDVGKVEVLDVGKIFDFNELQKVLDGIAPLAPQEDYRVHHNQVGEEEPLDKDTLKRLGSLVTRRGDC